MTHTLIGKKKGMVQLFDDSGEAIGCTVLEVEPNLIVQIKTKEKDGYEALQLGAIRKEKRVKPLKGHFAKGNVPFCRELKETSVESVSGFAVGQELSLSLFSNVKFVNVTGTSKGKGYQGVMKLHGFAGGPAAHGSKFHRHGGSTGMRTTPGRCLPGGKRASHMGVDRVTLLNLAVIQVDVENNLILVKGAVPGANESIIYLSESKRKQPKQINKKK